MVFPLTMNACRAMVDHRLIEFGVGVELVDDDVGPYSSRNRLALLVLKLRYVTFIVPTSTSLATRFLTPSLRQASPPSD